MKILKVENIIIIQDGNKKYKRIAKLQSNGNEVVEWRFNKSNHTVKGAQQKGLENRYKSGVTHIFSTESAVKRKSKIRLNTTKSAIMDLEVKRLMESGSKLGAVKHVKEVANLGLREAKDYVEDYARKNNIQDRRWK